MSTFGVAATSADVGELVEVNLDAGDRGREDGDWFCVKVKPYRCVGCGAKITHDSTSLDTGHFIVVYPDYDDPEMLKRAAAIKEEWGSAEIVPYEQALGPCISVYALIERIR